MYVFISHTRFLYKKKIYDKVRLEMPNLKKSSGKSRLKLLSLAILLASSQYDPILTLEMLKIHYT